MWKKVIFSTGFTLSPFFYFFMNIRSFHFFDIS